MTFRVHRSTVAATLTVATLLGPMTGQSQETYHGRRAWSLQNSKIRVIITPGGGHIASLTLRSGRGANLNPLWLPPWKSVEPGAWAKDPAAYGGKPAAQLLSCILGHNICVDFFGAPSAAEAAAGLPVHGEAPCIDWTASQKSADRIVYSATLPHAQMRVTRKITLTPNASTLWITESVENLSAIDRPFGWNQHVTLGPPFLQEGASFFDMPAGRSMVYPKAFSAGERLKRGAEFEWPEATGSHDEPLNIREFPKGRKSSDFTATLVPSDQSWAWFTAVNTKRGLLIGYVWPRKDWPWIANWEENRFRSGRPWLGRAIARGMEFGTTPFPDSRREAVSQGKLFGTPTYRWISAKAKQTIAYGAFLAPIPPGTTGVRAVRMEGSRIRIELDGVDRTITLPVRR